MTGPPAAAATEPIKTVSQREPLVPDEPLPVAARDGNSVYFPFGKTQIDAEGMKVIRRVVEALRSEAGLIVELTGRSDNLGSPAYNVAIAEQRVLAVKRALQVQGVKREQIRTYAIGNEGGDSCASAQCRQWMRRVELRIVSVQWNSRLGK